MTSRGRRRRYAWLGATSNALLLVAATHVAWSPAARADEAAKPETLPRRQAIYRWDRPERGGVLLRASFSYRDVAEGMTDRLASGLPTVVAMRAYLLREGEPDPVALAVRTCRVVYDLWDEVFRIKMTGPGGDRDTAALNPEGVLRQCAEVRDLPVAAQALVAPGKVYFLGVIVEVNPVSPEMIEQMRRWVARPGGSTGIGPGDALFGSFVGLFLRNIGSAERTLRFRTQSWAP